MALRIFTFHLTILNCPFLVLQSLFAQSFKVTRAALPLGSSLLPSSLSPDRADVLGRKKNYFA